MTCRGFHKHGVTLRFRTLRERLARTTSAAIASKTPAPLDRECDEVLSVLTDISRRTVTFAQQTGLACPLGCGACCTYPDVTATPYECLPLAQQLLLQGEAQAEAWLQQLQQAEGQRCVFYKQSDSNEGKGRCTIYPWRPSLCRLFGFAARHGKDGSLQLSACKVMKVEYPELVAAAGVAVSSQFVSAPVFQDVYQELHSGLCGGPLTETMHINKAVFEALRYMMWKQYLSSLQTAEVESTSGNPVPVCS